MQQTSFHDNKLQNRAYVYLHWICREAAGSKTLDPGIFCEVFVIAAAVVKCVCFRQEKKKSALLYDLSSAHQYASACSDIVPVARLCDPTPICQGWAEEK